LTLVTTYNLFHFFFKDLYLGIDRGNEEKTTQNNNADRQPEMIRTYFHYIEV